MKNREIKFRFWDGSSMLNDIDGWSEHVGINEMFKELSGNFKYTAMQYTCLKDKNGKEIYEGDIGRTNLGIGIVKFERQIGSFRFERRTMWDRPKITSRELNATYGDGEIYKAEWLEIIGNIYENPELLLNETQKGDSK